MKNQKKFIVKKDEKTDIITYMEYEKIKGLNIKPKHNKNFEDMINVDEMIIINSSLINKLIDKKCQKNLERIIKMLSIILEDDSDDDTPFMLALTEIERFKNLLITKYKDYMEEKEYTLQLKKLELLKQETEERRRYKVEKQLEYEQVKKGKSAR